MKRIALALVAVLTLGLGGLFASDASAQWGRRGGVSVNVGGWGGYRNAYRPYYGHRHYHPGHYHPGHYHHGHHHRSYWYGHRPHYHRSYYYGHYPHTYYYGRPGVYLRF